VGCTCAGSLFQSRAKSFVITGLSDGVRSTGSRLILTPFSVTETIAPFSRSSSQICNTLTSSRARSSPRRPSIRMRITDGPVTPDKASSVWKSASKCDNHHTFLAADVEKFRISCCR
jgi:hypothetical protein